MIFDEKRVFSIVDFTRINESVVSYVWILCYARSYLSDGFGWVIPSTWQHVKVGIGTKTWMNSLMTLSLILHYELYIVYDLKSCSWLGYWVFHYIMVMNIVSWA